MPRTSPFLAAGLAGFSLGGFFDGILLHQILQWHHFLSLAPGEAWQTQRAQILADGLFHVATYLLTVLSLWLLWRARTGLTAVGGRSIVGAALLGFAAWQFADVGLFHWIVGIHRIRVDVPNPLLWDIGWLVVTGLPPLLLGMWLLRGPGAGARGPAAAFGLSLLLLAAAPVAAMPAPGSLSAVLFRSDVGPTEAMTAVLRAGGRVVSVGAEGGMVVADLTEADTLALYRAGALLVGRSALTAGCLAWSRPSLAGSANAPSPI
ncbi:DUF2243 domain-containing protein [Sabulicella glaciei]|uniref:DUF2243 domain-containing protein n=1 Tax=Sabulicella glaciei TaxID=2984948 RepID=A0ABT3P112_9PROT|nr:DUF2243 domain-containing protein [Roseococcus sp. MDT2-1-1]MCW8088105.1 DUF2243 domain-containing protein [Roseococcus sp. MDT2-1-1]